MTADQFHDALHVDVGRPRHEVQTRNVGKWTYKVVVDEPWAHRAAWVSAVVSLALHTIKVTVGLNLKQNDLSSPDFVRLSSLVIDGIRRYWSRQIRVFNEVFNVDVTGMQNTANGLAIDLYIEKGTGFARSSNLSILGIDASLIYNAGFYPSTTSADQNFMLTAAHEFGHSVLTEYGGLSRSWTHEGSTSILQSTTRSTPGYPASGEINLMKYYDRNKAYFGPSQIYTNTRASEFDVKCLLWMSKLAF